MEKFDIIDASEVKMVLKYKCLVLDHDDTVMQSEKTLCYPCFVLTMQRLRPGINVTLEDYIRDCHTMGFYDMCKVKYGFSDEEMDALEI